MQVAEVKAKDKGVLADAVETDELDDADAGPHGGAA